MNDEQLAAAMVEIYERRGAVDKHIVLEEATPEDAPLHDEIKHWDDATAAHLYRLEEAHRLIRRVEVYASHVPGRKIRGFVYVPPLAAPASDPQGVPSKGGYHPVGVVARDPALRAAAETQMRSEWQRMKQRWSVYTEFWAMIADDLPGEDGETRAS